MSAHHNALYVVSGADIIDDGLYVLDVFHP